MFLLNLFGKSSSNSEQKFDIITFKINLNDNVPQFHDWSEQNVIEEEELTPSHPLYYQIFPKEEEKYVEYTTNQNDTLFGIAIKLDISEAIIREINNLSGSVYPGMKIKLPEGTDLQKLEEIPTEQLAKIRISQLLKPPEKSTEYINLKYSVSYYAGMSGYIKGSITVNASYLIFNPNLEEKENIEKFTIQRLLKFNAIVEIVDIQDLMHMEIPAMAEAEEMPTNLSVVQFMLYRVGNTKIEKKYKERLRQLKLDHKAIASMSFAVHGNEEKSGNELAEELVNKVKLILKEGEGSGDNSEGQQKNRLTNIPFFDIIHQNIQPKEEEVQVREPSKIIRESAILGTLLEPSEVVTFQEFNHLVPFLPVLYRLYNWGRLYSSTRDGTSFTTFLNRTKGQQPAILLIKEHKGYKFGAFLIEAIEPGKSGRGEMFIFSFKDKQTPQIFQWTGKNQTFVICDRQTGIGIGMGFKYGIWIKNDFDKGSTCSTLTFGNTDILSKKQDFYIEQLQIWGIDSSY